MMAVLVRVHDVDVLLVLDTAVDDRGIRHADMSLRTNLMPWAARRASEHWQDPCAENQ